MLVIAKLNEVEKRLLFLIKNYDTNGLILSSRNHPSYEVAQSLVKKGILICESNKYHTEFNIYKICQ